MQRTSRDGVSPSVSIINGGCSQTSPVEFQLANAVDAVSQLASYGTLLPVTVALHFTASMQIPAIDASQLLVKMHQSSSMKLDPASMI